MAEGEIFGLIGPNGAGKTTTMECVEGVRRPDRGRISILGLDPVRDVYELQNRIGVQLQQSQLQKRIKVWEAVDLWASLYKKTLDAGRLLEQLGLTPKRNAWFMNLSGGQKQRLFIALALINDPEVVFLDELTTGLDPQARHAIWDLVRRYCPERTVLLSTSDRCAEERLGAIPALESVTRQDERFTIQGKGDDFVTEVIQCLSENRIRVKDFRTVLPNLEDVFLRLTGRSIRD